MPEKSVEGSQKHCTVPVSVELGNIIIYCSLPGYLHCFTGQVLCCGSASATSLPPHCMKLGDSSTQQEHMTCKKQEETHDFQSASNFNMSTGTSLREACNEMLTRCHLKAVVINRLSMKQPNRLTLLFAGSL